MRSKKLALIMAAVIGVTSVPVNNITGYAEETAEEELLWTEELNEEEQDPDEAEDRDTIFSEQYGSSEGTTQQEDENEDELLIEEELPETQEAYTEETEVSETERASETETEIDEENLIEEVETDAEEIVEMEASAPDMLPLNETYFPDAQFRTALEEYDLDGDGYLSLDERNNVDELYIDDLEIDNLSGIEYFENLEYLDCSFNDLTTLDVSKNVNLKDLDCSHNELTTLDVSKNVNLKKLSCYYNELTTLDVSKNVNLWSLDCSDNALTSLDLSQNDILEDLDCSENTIKIPSQLLTYSNESWQLDLGSIVPAEYMERVVSVECGTHDIGFENGIITFEGEESLFEFKYSFDLQSPFLDEMMTVNVEIVAGICITLDCNDGYFRVLEWDPETGLVIGYTSKEARRTMYVNKGDNLWLLSWWRLNNLEGPVCSDPHKGFAGWSSTPNGAVITDWETKTAEQDMTLYAVWKPVYLVTYDGNGGSIDDSCVSSDGVTAVLKVFPGDSIGEMWWWFSKPGYEFADWSLDRDGNQVVKEWEYVPDGDVTLYAIWKSEQESGTESHSHKWDSGKVTKSPTCTLAGVKTYTCTECKETKTETIAPKGHSYGAWKTVSAATVFAAEVQQRTCSACGQTEKRSVGTKLKPTATVNVTTIPMKLKQSTTKVTVSGLANGDSVKSWQSSNTKIVKVDNKGKITAQGKTGKATITVTLASGLTKKISVNVQKKTVATTKLSGLPSKVTVEKGKKLTLTPVVAPITSQDKVTYKSSDKKIATVSSSGVITAKKAGTAKITVTSGKKKVTVKVTVPKTATKE